MACAGLQQLAEFAAFFSVPASSREFRPLATNQKVGSSNLSGRATHLQEIKRASGSMAGSLCCVLVHSVREMSVFWPLLHPSQAVALGIFIDQCGLAPRRLFGFHSVAATHDEIAKCIHEVVELFDDASFLIAAEAQRWL